MRAYSSQYETKEIIPLCYQICIINDSEQKKPGCLSIECLKVKKEIVAYVGVGDDVVRRQMSPERADSTATAVS